MISNSDLFFSRAKQFQDSRKEIMDVYEEKMKNLEDARGSKFFVNESKKVEAEKDNALKSLKDEYREYFRISLDAMSKANYGRKMVAPTEEELRTLQLLKMKENISLEELDCAANTLENNSTCIEVLKEITRKQGYVRNYQSVNKEMSISTVENTIKSIGRELHDFMQYDTSRAARLALERHNNLYGETPSEKPLSKRRLFQSKEECYHEFMAGLTDDNLTAFCKAVDGADNE